MSKSRDRPLRDHINTISRGSSSSDRNRHLRGLKIVHLMDKKQRSMQLITFTNEDFHTPNPNQDNPMVITSEIAWFDMNKALNNQVSSVNILYWKTFQKMDLSEVLILLYND